MKSPNIVAALLVGSHSINSPDDLSDLDFFLFVDDIDDWNRDRLIGFFGECGITPQTVYWNGLTKFHTIVDLVGVDFSILDRSRQDEIRRWPTLFYARDGILKDTEGTVRLYTEQRTAAAQSGLYNTLDGLLYHSSNVSIQLRRGEYLNARCRLTGVVESLLCLLEKRTLGKPNFREPSRKFELRNNSKEGLASQVAFSESPTQIIQNLRETLRWVESEHHTLITDEAQLVIQNIYHNLQEAATKCGNPSSRSISAESF